MQNSHLYSRTQTNLGEMAIEGLIAGLVAGIVMLLFLLAGGLVSAETVSLVLGGFSTQTPPNPVQGVLLHLAVSTTYGLVFGIIYMPLRRRFASWLLGLLYAVAIYLLAHFIVLPASGSRLLEMAPIQFALGHLIYGMVLGYWFREK